MGGGLMQLVAYGAQDVYLTGNPQITFFKVVYRRHTNFSMETIKQTIDGTSDINGSSTTRGTVTIARNGDLVHKIYVTAKDSNGITNGSALVQEVILEIGGQEIDKHTQEWNEIWSELTVPGGKIQGFKDMVGDLSNTKGLVQVPLNFWFCRNPGLALPLIALQYHEVKLFFTFGSGSQLKPTSSITPTVNVYCDYIYLDTDERRRFAQVSHEYLIEQLQIRNCKASNTQDLNFNHPVKELIWTCDEGNNYDTAKIVLNGQDRFEPQDEKYFQLRQPYDYHNAMPGNNISIPDLPGQVTHTINGGLFNVINVTGNDSITDDTDFNDGKLNIYATTGGLPISNWNYRFLDEKIPVAENGDSDDLANTFFVFDKIYYIRFKITYGGNNSFSRLHPIKLGETLLIRINGNNNMLRLLAITDSKKINTNSDIVSFKCVVKDKVGLNNNQNTTMANLVILNHNKFNRLFEHHSHTSNNHAKINVYSFGLKPEEHQPSGTCNFSRIDTAQLVTGNPLSSSDKIYAVNYNVLRIMSGMGGLAYSN